MKKQIWLLGLALSQMGISFIGILVGGVYIDRYFDTRPVFSAVGLILGSVVAISLLIRVVKMAKSS